MKKIICLILIFAFLISLSSCDKTPPESTEDDYSHIFRPTPIPPVPSSPTSPTDKNVITTPPDTTAEATKTDSTKTPEPLSYAVYKINENREFFKTHGRTAIEGESLICDSSASGIEFSAYIEGEVKLTLQVSAECYFSLFIDGVLMNERIKLSSGSTTVTIANFQEGGYHTIKLIKQTESSLSLCNIISVEFLGYFIDPPAAKELLIEFIGDSITAGYGNLCKNGTENPGSALYQDATKSYAFLTAQILSADASLVCCSGIGLLKSWTKFNIDSYYKAFSYSRNSEAPFTPDKTPSLVVINLGTNDKELDADIEEFSKKATELITYVRQIYGYNVPVIWLGGMMNTSYSEHIETTIAGMGGESNGLYTLTVDVNNEGGMTHPSGSAHISTAETLAKFIKEKGLNLSK